MLSSSNFRLCTLLRSFSPTAPLKTQGLRRLILLDMLPNTRRTDSYLEAEARVFPKCDENFADDLTRVGPSNILDAGLGLHAVSHLPRGSVLYAYTGDFVSEEEAEMWPNAHHLHLEGSGKCIDGSRVGSHGETPMKYINSADLDSANCRFDERQDRVFVVVSQIRDIQPNEELLINYDVMVWPDNFHGCAIQRPADFIR